MSTARDRVQQEAEDAKDRANFPVGSFDEELMYGDGYYEGFIAGRTVSFEKVEHAAESINEELVDRVDRGEMTIETDGPDPAELERALTQAAFSVAGFLIEGDES